MPKPYVPNDKWSQRAASEGYRARSVYKLQELDEKFQLLEPAMTVLDLGAAPGSWLQYIAQKIGEHGRAIGMDLQEIAPIEGPVQTFQVDITDTDAVQTALADADARRVDLVVSDLAPATSGVKDIDQWRSIELSTAVVQTAKAVLGPAGICVMKVFRGADFDEFLREVKKEWTLIKVTTVRASRDRSREVYVVVSLLGD